MENMADDKFVAPYSNSRYVEIKWQGQSEWQGYMSWLVWEYIKSFKYDPSLSFLAMLDGKEIQLHFFQARINKEIYLREEEQRKKK